MKRSRAVLPIVLIVAWCGAAFAQDKGSVDPQPLPPLANPNDPKVPAKELFGRAPTPANLQARAIGFYTKGCLAGGIALPVNGPTWQVMRLSRNRNWGHPDLVKLLERLADKAPTVGWNGLLVGDMAQARGGPMMTGHASHQVGLDADIWLTPMPNRELTRLEREEMSATNVVRPDMLDVDMKVWTPGHFEIIRRRRRTRRSNAFWSMRRSRRLCAAKPAAIAPGCTRCAPGIITTTISTFASAVRRTARPARGSLPRRKATAAARISPTGSSRRCCGRSHPPASPPKAPRNFIKLSDLPPECRGVLQAQ